MFDLALQVLTPSATVVSIAGGFTFGYLLLAQLIDSNRWGVPIPDPGAYGRLIAGVGVAYVVVFYIGQAVASMIGGDPQWPRVAARGVVFVAFAIAAGIGAWAGLHREWRR